MPNPKGKNQYQDCPPADDDDVSKALVEYHDRGITSAKTILALLKADLDVTISRATLFRRKETLNIHGSGRTTRDLPDTVKRQLVLDELREDPLSRMGPDMLRESILDRTGKHLTRDYVTSEMRLHDPEGFLHRAPTAKKIIRSPLLSDGPNHEWSADGHDKLSSFGFPIWGVRDKWASLWLLLRVVPNNQLKLAIAYLYLSLLYETGGMPIQSTTDCGSETTRMFALADALRAAFSDLPTNGEQPAHRFMRSVHNITVEHGWYRLRVSWGDNIKATYESGSHLYNPLDATQHELHEWLWPKFVQQELDSFRNCINNHVTRYDKDKVLPSGVAPSVSYTLYQQYGGRQCLIPVDREVVKALMDEIGEDVIRFVSREYEAKAEAAFATLGIPKLTKQNIWRVFVDMIPLMS
ncbi:hypothetical protein BDN70DRAFT_815066 [Pholiota conissans]|uniref:Integrase core domain-containing protein n=1 Tax=Pholiota conissans TaxID=109636 RepID=A0A9P5YVS1_9AGAR|nr:hypothetical protein BDN70DRAFT_815066 [Pholiota conissans]